MNNTQKTAVKYFSEMLTIHGNESKTVRNAILNNLVNSEYGRTSNQFVEYVWNEFNNHFKS